MGGSKSEPVPRHNEDKGASETRDTHDKYSRWLNFGTLCILMYLILGSHLVYRVESDRHLVEHGLQTSGTVENVEWEPGSRGNGAHTTLRIRYDRGDGSPARFEQDVPGRYQDGPVAEPSAEVTVFYHPDGSDAVAFEWQDRYGIRPVAGTVLLLVVLMFYRLFSAAFVPYPQPAWLTGKGQD